MGHLSSQATQSGCSTAEPTPVAILVQATFTNSLWAARSELRTFLFEAHRRQGWRPPLASRLPPSRGPRARRRTEVVEHALLTPWPPRDAHPTPMQDQPQRQPGPLLGCHHPRHERLDLLWVLRRYQSEQVRQPLHMRVDGEAGHVEADSENHIRGLAPDARQLDEIVQVARHDTVEQIHQLSARGDDRARFGAEESGRLDQLLDPSWIRGRKVERGRVVLEQHWRDEID